MKCFKRPIWLFGENLGATANNNSYYFWRHVVNSHTENVRPYFIIEKNKTNKFLVRGFSKQERDYVVWRHSFRHAFLYLHCEFSFVTLSFRDVWPDHVNLLFGLKKSFKPVKRCSLIYLQHGTSGIKALGYGPNYADGTMLRFVHYNPFIPETMMRLNKFRPYQFFYGVYHPRYQGLLQKVNKRRGGQGKKILWFLTWREYMGKNISTYKFFSGLAKVLASPELHAYLDKCNGHLEICLHALCSTKCALYLPMVQKYCSERIKIVYASKINVMDSIVCADLLITDYSSLGFDFTFLRKPVILYAPDFMIYRRSRTFYCADQEYRDAAIFSQRELIRCIVHESYKPLNSFFVNRAEIPDKTIYAEVLKGTYIERMYQYFWTLQRDTYAFLGYDFSGVGGTVYATKALAEGLLERGNRVVFCPLKNGAVGVYPNGIINRPMIDLAHRSKLSWLLRKLVHSKSYLSYLREDKDAPNLEPYCGYALTRLLKNICATAVISTRETLHFFANDATSPWIRNRYYYFHCHGDLTEKIFPGVIGRLQKRELDTAVFVTDKNKKLLERNFGYHQYRHAIISGNALDSSRMIDYNNIKPILKKSCYRVAYLLRISKERWPDVERALSFARYLRNKKNNKIKIDIYGKGDQVLKLQYLLVDEELDSIMAYRGETRNIVSTYAKYDAITDFSKFQSFGMGYIEAIFNGKVVFCRHNEGSDEVLGDIPSCFFDTDAELEKKILALPKVSVEQLQRNYKLIEARYSRNAVVDKFILG